MFIVTVRFSVAPENATAFGAAVIAQAQNSVSLEPGCLTFDVCVDPANPAEVFLYEKYTDKAAFDEHLASAHYKTFDANVSDAIVEKTVDTWVSASRAS